MHFFEFSEELEFLPPPQFALLVAQLAKQDGMNDAEIFAFVEFMCGNEEATIH